MSLNTIRTTLLSVVVGASFMALPLTACGGKKDATPAADKAAPAAPKAAGVSAAAKAAAETKWKMLCTSCHGATGKGDGAAAASLEPKPRSFGDAKWQASVTDAHLAKVILEGGPSVKLSPLMPPNPDLKGKPEVVKALVQMVRSFK